jgi:predicted ATP-dependent endonuclease of OLD family
MNRWEISRLNRLREVTLRLRHVNISNFRCAAEAQYDLGDLTSFVGSNGAGKSTLIRALILFYDGFPRPTVEDFFNRQSAYPIEITLVFDALSTGEISALGDIVDEDGTLRITLRVFWHSGDGQTVERAEVGYFVKARKHPAFEEVRALGSATDRQAAAKDLVEGNQGRYDVELARSWAATDTSLRDWETRNPDQCEVAWSRLDMAPPNEPNSKLHPFTQLVFVPAVRDAADEAVEGRGNLMSRLVDLAVGDIGASPEFQQADRDFKERYKDLVQATSDRLLPRLTQRIERALHQFAPGVAVRLQWGGADVRLVSPHATVYLDDGGFMGDVVSKGHGLQRLFIISLLQAAAELLAIPLDTGDEAQGEGEPGVIHYVLAIEEPELYQHPIQARKFAQVLTTISSNPATNTQVVLSTHSPFFVAIDQYDSLIVVRKVASDQQPPRSVLSSSSIESVMHNVEQAFQRDEFNQARFKASMASIITTSVREGFFASIVVLVEGDEDRALVEAGLRLNGVDIEGSGISVIPVNGKTNLDRCLAIFDSLGIPCYLVFDADAGKPEGARHEETNQALQRLCGIEDPAALPSTSVGSRFTVFQNDFAAQLAVEIPDFVVTRNTVAEELGWLEPSLAAKNPAVIAATLGQLASESKASPTLNELVAAIRALVG